MSVTRRVSAFGKTATLWVAIVIAVLCTSLGALFFFTAALLIWLNHYVGPAAAAAIAGLVLLLEAVAIALGGMWVLKRMQTRQPSLDGGLLGIAGMALRLGLMVVRRSPRKAMITALLTGILADYFTTSRTPKE